MKEATYNAIHVRLYRKRGKAKEHVCPCGAQAEDWAYDHESFDEWLRTDEKGRTYSLDIFKYKALCTNCHMRYDKALITHCPHDHEYTPENTLMDAGKRKCKTCVYARNNERRRRVPMTPEQHARKMDLQRQRRAAKLISSKQT